MLRYYNRAFVCRSILFNAKNSNSLLTTVNSIENNTKKKTSSKWKKKTVACVECEKSILRMEMNRLDNIGGMCSIFFFLGVASRTTQHTNENIHSSTSTVPFAAQFSR